MASSRDIVRCDCSSCAKPVDVEIRYVTCPLCRAPKYCSEDCQVKDWVIHNCPNVLHASKLEVGFAVPYYYEDMLDSEAVAGLKINDPVFQSYMVRHNSPDRLVSQYEIPSLLGGPLETRAISRDDYKAMPRGKPPGKSINKLRYSIAITGKDTRSPADVQAKVERTYYFAQGEVPRDMIFANNRQNPRASELAGTGLGFFKGGARRAFSLAGTQYVFWPANKQLIDQYIIMPLVGPIDVTLQIAPTGTQFKNVLTFEAEYELSKTQERLLDRIARAVQDVYSRQLALKFQDSGMSTKSMQVCRYTDEHGNIVLLTFLVTPQDQQAQLIDVELAVRASLVDRLTIEAPRHEEVLRSAGLSEEDEYADEEGPMEAAQVIEAHFACDEKNFSLVSGLAMALDHFIAAPPAEIYEDADMVKEFEEMSSIIKNYLAEMEANGGKPKGPVPPEVISAIAGAQTLLYDPIGRSDSQWRKKVQGTIENVEAEAASLKQKLFTLRRKQEAIRDSTKFGDKIAYKRMTLQKKIILGDLNRFKKALANHIASLRRAGVTGEVMGRWEAVERDLQNAEGSGVME